MNTESVCFAHGSPAAPMIVDSFEHAKQRANEDAARRGEAQAVLALDLHHPEHSAEIIGYAYPYGSYTQVSLEVARHRR